MLAVRFLTGYGAGEKYLFNDYLVWRRQHNQIPISSDSFCAMLNQWFCRDAEGWQGICIGPDWRVNKVTYGK